MDGDADGDRNEQDAEEQMLGYKYGAEKKGYPDGADRHDLNPHRDGFVKHKIGYIYAHPGMIHQPII